MYTEKKQPFSVKASSSALLVADFHSHLASTEIIGLLGGHWDSNAHGKLFLAFTGTRQLPCSRRFVECWSSS